MYNQGNRISNQGKQFEAQPKVIKGRDKYRDPYQYDEDVRSMNIMWDRRVVRGNTYAAMVIPNQTQDQ